MENNKLFVYGILKRGLALDLEQEDCKFLGEASIQGATLYRIGDGVGLRFDAEVPPGPYAEYDRLKKRYDATHEVEYRSGKARVVSKKDPLGIAHGELFEIRPELWPGLDRIESNGFCYTRKEVEVSLVNTPEAHYEYEECGNVTAWVYEHTYPGFEYTNPIENGRY